jgi:thymidylate synthase (FAD)
MATFTDVKYPVLDRGFIELQETMGDWLAVVNAARVSYMSDSKGEAKDKKLLAYLYSNKHNTPFEQLRFRFRVKAPKLVSIQWMRYRASSFNEQSYRYTEAIEEDFYIPTIWRLQDQKNRQGSSDEVLENDLALGLTHEYAHHIRTSYDRYAHALELGVAREQARLFLPAFGLYTQFVWNVDARNLLHFLDERCDEHAQYEIRAYALIIRDYILQHYAPEIYTLYTGKEPVHV